ncbi:DNA (cytosine-5-)-methyltransferase N-terminal subunit [Metamycoplasma auris]|uniref:DNA (cytosine-5-)-methyltransferase N-terminal subunit n=1 Tax=Metamycoplasma auris TaxID=51363 RepID=UPI00068B5B5B|nr:hypothetical protein [Metamycoplasma auris]
MKKVTIYEMFAGIGSQLKACNNISNQIDCIFKSVGVCEWYIDAIIVYMKIHYGNVERESEFKREEMANILSKFSFSADSKTLVSKKYFYSMNKEKLSKIFPYLYGFLDKDYFERKWKITVIERERERERERLK